MNPYEQFLKRYQYGVRTTRRKELVFSTLQKELNDKTKVLDLGCGVGAISSEFRDKGLDVISLDISKNALTLAVIHYNLDLIVRADCRRLPFSDRSFDAVLMVEVLEDVGDNPFILAEVRRILKDKGLLLITTSPIKSDIYYPLLKHLGFYPIKDHVNELHPNELKRMLKDFDFAVIMEKYWNPFHLYFVLKTFLKNPLEYPKLF